MLKSLVYMYRLRFAETIIYMLQATEYDVKAYLRWLWRVKDFEKVSYRRSLIKTRRSSMLLLAIKLGMLVQFAVAIAWASLAIKNKEPAGIFAVDLFLSTPLVWSHLVVLPLVLARWFWVQPLNRVDVGRSKKSYQKHRAIKIAVAGSYGKTTMKEILLVVLAEGTKVAATPANKNVAISHAQFAKQLEGDEDILIVEFGEGAPGDVAGFAQTVKPDIGIITGLAPAHLDKYKTLQRAGEDIFSLAQYLDDKNVYVNGESEALKSFIKPGHQLYDGRQAAGWAIKAVKSSINGLSFEMTKDGKNLKIKSQLIGEHQIGPLALAAALADKLGLTKEQIEKGISKVESFEHRMQPRQVDGACIIDDTYNGNIDGMLAGLKLLKSLPAKRRIYVTPGLVDQGAESAKIHRRLGEAIAGSDADLVVLMKHSVTDDIVAGIKQGKFKGELKIEEDPLNFYTNLDQFVATGDLVVLQNDWPDNYN